MAIREVASPRDDEPVTAASARAARRERIANLRKAQTNEKVIIGFVLLAGIISSLVFVDSLNVRSSKALAGMIVASLTFPTIAVFVLYEPVRKLVRRVRGLF